MSMGIAGVFAGIAAFLLMISPAAALSPITGYSQISEYEKRAGLGIEIAENSTVIFDLGIPESSEITSLRASGRVVGRGEAMAFLKTERKLLKIFSENQEEFYGKNAITGLFVAIEGVLTGNAALGETAEAESVFHEKCIDTCYISIEGNSTVEIVFVVEPGTRIELDSISYQHRTPGPEGMLSSFLSQILNIFD